MPSCSPAGTSSPIFTPQFRVHGTGAGKEIWNWDGDVQPRLIENVKLRYRLLPYIYSLSWDVAKARGTMMRALAFDFAADPKALSLTDEYMFGKALLVCSGGRGRRDQPQRLLARAAAVVRFLDRPTRRRGQTIEAAAPIERIPVYARAGSVVPIGPVKPYADAPTSEPPEIRVYPGADGDFALYDDAGDGFGFESGDYELVRLAWDDRKRELTIAPREGHYAGAASTQPLSIVCASNPAAAKTVRYTGTALHVALDCR